MYKKLLVGFDFNAYIVIGQVFADGQNKDVWCDSKKIISDPNMYYEYATITTDPIYKTNPTCYNINYFQSLMRLSIDDAFCHP